MGLRRAISSGHDVARRPEAGARTRGATRFLSDGASAHRRAGAEPPASTPSGPAFARARPRGSTDGRGGSRRRRAPVAWRCAAGGLLSPAANAPRPRLPDRPRGEIGEVVVSEGTLTLDDASGAACASLGSAWSHRAMSWAGAPRRQVERGRGAVRHIDATGTVLDPVKLTARAVRGARPAGPPPRGSGGSMPTLPSRGRSQRGSIWR
jgi:hypothetical protein